MSPQRMSLYRFRWTESRFRASRSSRMSAEREQQNKRLQSRNAQTSYWIKEACIQSNRETRNKQIKQTTEQANTQENKQVHIQTPIDQPNKNTFPVWPRHYSFHTLPPHRGNARGFHFKLKLASFKKYSFLLLSWTSFLCSVQKSVPFLRLFLHCSVPFL